MKRSPSLASLRTRDVTDDGWMDIICLKYMKYATTIILTSHFFVFLQSVCCVPSNWDTTTPDLWVHLCSCIYPSLCRLAVGYLYTPTSSVPCERVFAKPGEVITKEKNHQCGKKILFLSFYHSSIHKHNPCPII